ncbi:MAG: ATP-binding protein [Deltaproteobacteria bacterium]|nr:ATP-binding protein [Deltaproteobacteria bacterium]MBI4373753.1 ATP-binding protein [Deltaproteobacteria bacterium]
MGKILKRLLDLNLPKGKSAFLWGPRKAGKSYWVQHHLPQATVVDLLKTDLFAEYSSRPSLLRERFLNHQKLIVIDEIQKVPSLLDEVHWLIENRKQQFLLTGSSARKLKRGHANLLGGRAWRRQMTPLIYEEVEGFDLEKAMTSGLLPPHFLSPDPIEDLRAYISDYLKEEIAAEALTQNIPAFSEFLRVAALTSSELLNYTNVGREAGISAKVVRGYFQILEDTYLGFRIPPWRKSRNRRMIETEKFYLFDVGVANYLSKRTPRIGSYEFGKSFEHFILMELMSYKAYRNPEMEITFWRTSTNQEVDFIVNDREMAIEIKGSSRVHEGDLKSMNVLLEDGPVRRKVIVCLEKQRRLVGNQIEIIPWQEFLKDLWRG